MLTILFSLISIFNSAHEVPTAQVEGGGAEVEAVFVPADYVGPIVAVPFDEVVF